MPATKLALPLEFDGAPLVGRDAGGPTAARKPSPTARGRSAEAAAARHLESQGFTVVARNWRTRYCEIDLIARRGGRIHFIEIKYRATPACGDGFAYITWYKQVRLIRAAAAWCLMQHYAGDYQIDVMSVSGPLDTPQIDWLENVVTM